MAAILILRENIDALSPYLTRRLRPKIDKHCRNPYLAWQKCKHPCLTRRLRPKIVQILILRVRCRFLHAQIYCIFICTMLNAQKRLTCDVIIFRTPYEIFWGTKNACVFFLPNKGVYLVNTHIATFSEI